MHSEINRHLDKYGEIYGPWENPPRIILSLGVPSRISSAMVDSTIRRASSRPLKSSRSIFSRLFISCQQGIGMPIFNETGPVGAFGKTNYSDLGIT